MTKKTESSKKWDVPIQNSMDKHPRTNVYKKTEKRLSNRSMILVRRRINKKKPSSSHLSSMIDITPLNDQKIDAHKLKRRVARFGMTL